MMLVGYTVCSKYDKNLLFVAVIKALVTGYKEIYSPTEAYYAIELTGPKIGASLEGADVSKVYTERQWCTVTFQKDNTYIISGEVRNGKLMVGACNFVKRWDEASSDEQELLSNPGTFCPPPISLP